MTTPTPQDPLSALLASIPKVRDSGFHRRVMYRIHVRALRRRVIFFSAWCCALTGIVLSLPLRRFGENMLALEQSSTSAWTQFPNAAEITQVLNEYLQISNFNIVITLSAGAVFLVLAAFSLLRY